MRRLNKLGKITVSAILVAGIGLTTLLNKDVDAGETPIYEEVYMWEGGTVWQLAEKYKGEIGKGDTRDVMYENIYLVEDGEMIAYSEFQQQEIYPGMKFVIKMN